MNCEEEDKSDQWSTLDFRYEAYVIETLYRSVSKAIADILLGEVLMIEQVIGHQRLFVSDVVLFDGRQTNRLDEGWVRHQIALVVHYETSHLILATDRAVVRLQELVKVA